MDRSPSDDPRILERLDACRPGSNDLADPEMEILATRLATSPELDELRQRLQRLDRELGHAFRDVPVPEGLADRILARLAAGEPSSRVPEGGFDSPEALADSPQATASPSIPEVPSKERRRTWRRWWLALAAPAALAASLLIMFLMRAMHPADLRSPEDLCNKAIAYYLADSHQGSQSIASGSSATEACPFSASLSTQFPQIAWRSIQGFLDRSGVAYDIVGPGGGLATLYVIAGPVNTPLGSEPPGDPMHSTAQCSAAAWLEGSVVYVLVAAGEAEDYRRVVWYNAGPMT